MPREQAHHKIIQYTDWATIALFFAAFRLLGPVAALVVILAGLSVSLYLVYTIKGINQTRRRFIWFLLELGVGIAIISYRVF